MSEGLSFRKIAAILERSPSTISREVKRNAAKYKPHRKSDNKFYYNYWHAQNLYVVRRRLKKRRALKPGSEAWNYIIAALLCFWTPEQICKRWSLEHPNAKPLHHSTIYRYIARKEFPNVQKKTHLRRKGKKKQTKNANYNTIHPDRIIPEWPEYIRLRLRIGDWEGDTIYGGPGKGLLVSMVDRKSRYVRIGLLKSRNAEETRAVIERLLRGLPVNSISLDNGSEFSQFHELEQSLNTLVYFAEPHKPWQRGTNENTNDIIRFFFPKGFDFRTVTDEDVQRVEDLINNRPRKCLGWKTPKEVFFQEFGVALA